MTWDNPNFVEKQLAKIDMAFFYMIVILLRTITSGIDLVLDLLLGFTLTGGTREERLKAKEHYEQSAQLVSIWGRGAFSFVARHYPENYWYFHKAYVHPEEILRNEKATLQGVTNTHAFFCISRQDKDVYDTSLAPFVFLIQFFEAQELYILPLKSMYRLADELGDPKVEVSLLHMTARCGSTLVSQMLAKVPRVRVMSEPWAFAHLHSMYIMKTISYPEYERLMRATMRLQLKPEKEFNPTHVMIKMSNMSSSAFRYYHEMFPKFKLMFITRHPKPSMKSYWKVVKSLPQMYYKTGQATQWWFQHLPFPYEKVEWWDRLREWYHEKRYARAQPETHVILGMGGQLEEYLDTKDMYEKKLIFEDLKANPEKEIGDVFDVMGLDKKHIPAALTALKEDSQAGTFGPMGTGHINVSEDSFDACDSVLKEIGSPFRLNMTMDELRNLIY